MADIEYFYSIHSSYAYLGSARFFDLARTSGRRVVHKPIDLNRVVPASGSSPFSERSAAYRQYFFEREIQRWSEYRGAPVMGRPTHHQNDTTRGNCMLTAGVVQGINIDKLTHALMEAHWRYDADHDDPETLVRVGNEAGYDAAALLAAGETAEVRAAYEANITQAIDRSVFGSPTYFVDGDMFYGQDRLELVEIALKKPFAKTWSGA